MIFLRYLCVCCLLMLSALSHATTASTLNNSSWDLIGPYSDRSLGYLVLKDDGRFFSFKKSLLGSQLVNGSWSQENNKLTLQQTLGRYLVGDALIARDNLFKPATKQLTINGAHYKSEALILKPRAQKERFVDIQNRYQSKRLMQNYYAEECNNYININLYEPALLSCYNAYKLGKKEMAAVLYGLGKYGFFDQVTSNNLLQEYKNYKKTTQAQRRLTQLKFASQAEEVSTGSIYGNWCLDKDMYHGTEYSSLDGYERLILKPGGDFLQVTGGILKGKYSYQDNTLSLGDTSYSKYEVQSLEKNQLKLRNSSWKDGQVYSRQACTKLGLQRFMQAIVKNMSTSHCDGLNNYLGDHLLPIQYFPKTVLNKLKEDPKRYECPRLIATVSAAYKAHKPTSFPENQTFTAAIESQNYQRVQELISVTGNTLIDDETINDVNVISYAIAEQDDELLSVLLTAYTLPEKELYSVFSEAKGMPKSQTLVAKQGLTPLVQEWGYSILVMLEEDIAGIDIIMSVQKDVEQYSEIIKNSVFKLAASKSKNIDAYVKVMQKYGFDIQARNTKGQTLAMVTALAGGFTYLDSLLNQGFSLDDKDNQGLTTKSYILMCDYGNRYVERYFNVSSLTESEAQASLEKAFNDNNLQTFYGVLKAFPNLKLKDSIWHRVVVKRGESKENAMANLLIAHNSTSLNAKPDLSAAILAIAPSHCGANSTKRSYVGSWGNSDAGIHYDFSQDGTFFKQQFGREVNGTWQAGLCGLELSFQGIDGYVYEPVKSHTDKEIVGNVVLGRTEPVRIATTED
ncbi:MAG: hypothetical protein V7765_16710 [Oleispira sp.]